MRRINYITAAFCLVCVASAATVAQEPLRITIGAASEGTAQRFGSRPATSVTTLDGARVILQRATGRDYMLEAGTYGWSWFQVEQVPAQASYISLTPRLEDQRVTLEFIFIERTGDDFISLESSASGPLDTWIVLAGEPPGDGGSGTRTYRSASSSEQLAVKVEKMR